MFTPTIVYGEWGTYQDGNSFNAFKIHGLVSEGQRSGFGVEIGIERCDGCLLYSLNLDIMSNVGVAFVGYALRFYHLQSYISYAAHRRQS